MFKSSKMKYNNLEWRQTPSTSRAKAPREYVATFSPRSRPCNLMVGVDNEVHRMKPVEYLIGYSNGITSIGVAKTKNLSANQPLTMQFGNWKSELKAKELYAGCVVVVKSYYSMSRVQDDKYELREIVKQDAKPGDFFFRGRLCANTVACEWAIRKQPKLKPTLGTIKDFWFEEDEYGFKVFYGVVYDQERGDNINVYNDQWPMYIKRSLSKDTPVILNWIDVKEAHTINLAKDNFQIMFPNREDLPVELEARALNGNEWLGWVDTRYWGSD